jgi:stalled ribosome rescue protein Dom34
MMLTIDIQKVDFDPDVLVQSVGTVRVKTISFVWVRITHSHVGAQSELSIEKQCWDHISRSIDEAIHPERQAEIAAVVMQTGLCTFVSCHGA